MTSAGAPPHEELHLTSGPSARTGSAAPAQPAPHAGLGLDPVDAIQRDLCEDGLVLRYRTEDGGDGLPGREGAFLPCSFWLVRALATSGRLDEAQGLFDDLLPLGGPLGLYAEEMEPSSGRHLGNFPQALTHAALVQAVLALDDRPSPLVSRSSAPHAEDLDSGDD
jgi:hypothetical protein